MADLQRPSETEVYLLSPKIIDALCGKVTVTKVAAGEAHSLALGGNGEVFGWGYTYCGQLGTGTPNESRSTDPSATNITTPIRINSVKNQQITQAYSGQTFSLFVNDRREVFGCGSNDFCQLGIESQKMSGKSGRSNDI